MHLKTQNVNTGFRDLVFMFSQNNLPGAFSIGGENGKFLGPGLNLQGTSVVSEPSRNGNVLRITEPVTITYSRPTERVLFNSARDANPFFHVYESLWMLAGRNDVAPLAYYNKRMAEFSDDGGKFNGAYGYRWRKASHWQGHHYSAGEYSAAGFRMTNNRVDQLDLLVNHLRTNPTSRRAVLQMWNVEDDLLRVDSSKDTCCNLSVLFSLRKKERTDEPEYYLDMTVTNRSNDLIWGTLAADYMTFTVLQEYMAARLGVDVGVYNQFSNNLHVYDWNWKPQEWLAYYGSEGEVEYVPGCNIVPLIKDPAVFERELPEFVERHSKDASPGSYLEPFLLHTAQPMMLAYHFYKRGDLWAAQSFAQRVEADDWRWAATAWIERRITRKEKL